MAANTSTLSSATVANVAQALPTAAAPRRHALVQDDIYSAWEALSISGKSVLSREKVHEGLQLVSPGMSAAEARHLMGDNWATLTPEKLSKLLLGTEAAGKDPLPPADEEGFKLLDPSDTGLVPYAVLRNMLKKMPGMQNWDHEDDEVIQKLLGCASPDGITLEEFAKIGTVKPPRPDLMTPFAKKQLALLKAQAEQDGDG